jgi:redox-sensitive bicupin YhaK (pirin superfamily)
MLHEDRELILEYRVRNRRLPWDAHEQKGRCTVISVRRADDRGKTDLGWLDSRHTFAFGHGVPGGTGPDPMGFRGLRVINDDRVAPGRGFNTHPHDNMEIVSYIVEGELEHMDSMGTAERIGAGGFQLTSAGSGVSHSEYNPSDLSPTRFIQVWIRPAQLDAAPSYALLEGQNDRSNALRLAASPDGRDGSMPIGADAMILIGNLDDGAGVTHRLEPGRHLFVQVVNGNITLNGEALGEGDGAAVSDVDTIELVSQSQSEILVFDLS